MLDSSTSAILNLGLLKKGLSVFRQRCEENDAGVSDATAAVADDRFRVGLRPSSKAGLFNSPTVPSFPVTSQSSIGNWITAKNAKLGSVIPSEVEESLRHCQLQTGVETKPRLCLSKYVAVYVSMYAGLCLALRIHLYLLLNLDLDLSLDLPPYLALNRALFQRSFQKPFERPNPSSFRSL